MTSEQTANELDKEAWKFITGYEGLANIISSDDEDEATSDSMPLVEEEASELKSLPKPKRTRRPKAAVEEVAPEPMAAEPEIPPPPPMNYIAPGVVTPNIKNISFAVRNDTAKVWKTKLVYVALVWTRDSISLLGYPKVKHRLLEDVPVDGFVERNLPIPPGGKPQEANGIGVDVLLDGERWLGCRVEAPLVGW